MSIVIFYFIKKIFLFLDSLEKVLIKNIPGIKDAGSGIRTRGLTVSQELSEHCQITL